MTARPQRPQALAILGPTASGKTALALALLEHLPVDIISVDSAQVYRGMDIGTAKPDPETLARAPHRLIDIRDPAETYSGAEFIADARREMAAIAAQGRVPLLVGGTMLYFQLLLEGLADLPPAHPEIRAELADEATRHGWPHLHAELARVDPITAARLHPQHSRRIQRALEIYRTTGSPPSQLLPRRQRPVASDYDFRQVALVPADRSRLHRRIEQRFMHMLEAGFLDEVRALRARADLHPRLPALRAAGYRQAWTHLAGECDVEEMIATACAATRQLAKRQLTWLRGWREPLQARLDPFAATTAELAENLVQQLK